MSEASRIPAKDWRDLAPVQGPAQPVRKLQRRRRLTRRTGPGQGGQRPGKLGLDVRPEMKRKADIVVAAKDLVDDFDRVSTAVQANRAAM